jgi:hypothetical protein
MSALVQNEPPGCYSPLTHIAWHSADKKQSHDSPFSEILRAENNGHSDWRVYSEVGPLQSISPFFSHGPTPSLLYEAVLIGDELSASPESRRVIYAHVLERVRNGDQKGARELIENWRQSQK